MIKKQKNMTIMSRANSFIFAFNGLKLLPREPNIKLHAIATVVVVAAGYFKNLDRHQWIAIVSYIIGMDK